MLESDKIRLISILPARLRAVHWIQFRQTCRVVPCRVVLHCTVPCRVVPCRVVPAARQDPPGTDLAAARRPASRPAPAAAAGPAPVPGTAQARPAAEYCTLGTPDDTVSRPPVPNNRPLDGPVTREARRDGGLRVHCGTVYHRRCAAAQSNRPRHTSLHQSLMWRGSIFVV